MRRIIGAFGLCLFLLAPAAAQAGGSYDSSLYRKKVTLDNILKHEAKLQQFADNNGGARVAGSVGNVRTVRYIQDQMRAAGWKVKRQSFEFPYFQELSDPVFARTAPDPVTFANETDFATMEGSPSGDVTAPVTPVDVIVPMDPNSPAGTSNSGCEPEDFAGFPSGNVALMQRGTCTFADKVANAAAAGATAAVIFNEGQPGRDDVVGGTLGGVGAIPAIGTSYAIGADNVERVRAGQPVTFRVRTDTLNENRTADNVIADSPGGDPARTVVVAAHTDTTPDGPGINDDGSGTAMNLELARQLGHAGTGQRPRNHVRFVWANAEEEGLVGSRYYVDSLTDTQRSKIIGMLDFDMMASSNFVRFVYDGDGSTFGPDAAGPDGSGLIESLFTQWFDRNGLASEPTEMDGRTDYAAYTDAGIPAGGLFAGADGIKTPEQAAVFGGTAGLPYEPCYHEACDRLDNLNLEVFGQMKDAAADVLYQLALTRNAIVNGGSIRSARRSRAARSRAAARDYLGDMLRR